MAAKTYILTGCGSGIGQRVAQKLLEQGEKVCATDINVNTLESLKSSAKSADQLCLEYLDVKDVKQWEDLFQKMEKRWNKIDVLMNIAGLFHTASVEKLTPDVINKVIDTNLKGVIFGTITAARHMLPQKSGHIINIASIAGIVAPSRYSIYSASKYGVRGFSLAAGQDLYEHGIKLTVVCPAAVKTPMIVNKAQLEQDDAAFSYGGTLIEVDEVADAILNKALKKAPLEIVVPAKDGITMKVLSLISNISFYNFLRKSFQKKGLKVRDELMKKLKK